MKMERSVRVIVAVIVIATAAVLLRSGGHSELPALITQLHAQTAQAGADILFFPVGNQDVRKFVFWDRRANQIHIYGGGGKFEETFQIGAMGQDLKKQ